MIEGACRHFVKDRCELSGMRWLQTGAENLLRLRAVAENNDWDDYHAYRKQQRHRRLYGSRQVNPETVEIKMIRLHTPISEPFISNSRSAYQQLPLAS